MSTQDDRSAAPLDRIRLTGVSATGYHGVFEHERREGQTFVADVVAYVDTRRAAARDDLAHTLDYGTLAQQVVAVLAGEPADLIETVAERIAATVLSHAVVQGVDVTLHKPQAPIPVPFGDVTVEIHRDRNKLPAAEPVLADGTTAERPPRAAPVRTAAMPVVGGPAAAGAGAAAAAAGLTPAAPPFAGTPSGGDPGAGAAVAAAGLTPPAPPFADASSGAGSTGPAARGTSHPLPEPAQPAPAGPPAVADAAPVADAPVWAPIPGLSNGPAAPEPVEPVVIAPAPVDALPTGVVPSVAPAGAEAMPPVPPLAPAAPVPPVAPAAPVPPFVPPAPPLVAPATPVPPATGVTPVPGPPTTPVPPAPTTTTTAEQPAAASHAPVGELVPVDVVEGELLTDALDEAPPVPVDVVIALGANLGPAQETLRQAVHDLAATPGLQIVQVSPLARTAPVGGPEQPDFLNAVVLARTTLAPRELLHAAQRIEQGHGRERHEHWGPRTLDVDLVVYGGVLAVTDDLELPHPRAHQRAFVLQPWAEVDPHAVLPGLGGGPVAQLAATAPDREGLRWMALDWLEAPSPAPAPAPAAPAPAVTAQHAPSAPPPAGEQPPARDV